MFWSFVAVHLLIIAVISNDSFPIDLKEIDPEDIYLVDKERKGRFIQVNQTTFLPNPIELIRAKKSSSQDADEKLSDANALIPDEKGEQSPTKNNVTLPSPPPVYVPTPYKREEFVGQNNSACADSLFEPQTFGYPSFFEDQFTAQGHLAFIDNPTNCCNFEQLMNTFTGSVSCVDEYIVPQENLFC